MNEERNPALERLFGAADRKLDDEAFIARVMARTNRPRLAPLLIGLAILLAAVPIAWLAGGPLHDALLWVTQLMAKPIAGTGQGLSGPAVLPMNNVGAALVLALLGLRAVARWLFSSR